MADMLHDDILDAALAVLDNTEKLVILSADPGLTWANIATYKLGEKATPTIGAVEDRTGGGRKRTVSAITDGSVTATGTATHFALTDDSATKILATGDLSASQGVTSGNTFTLTAFDIGIPDPA
ncbi:MAG: hypothetical protein RBT11_14295 [Desulfobacterales bacterium]|jgi:hypothetical protein|nr:hypothetical protein [Desulfobacterales bacterium]